jgi:hypothetical protein
LEVSGRITGDVVSLGGLVRLRDTAVINGNVQIPAGDLDRAALAHVDGQITKGADIISTITLPGGIRIPNINLNFNPFWYGFSILSVLFGAFVWAALAALVVVLLPRQVVLTAQTFVSQPLIAGGLGLTTVILSPIFLVLTAITLIGIPLTLAGALLLALSWAFGIIALGTELGRRLAISLKQDWALAVSAAFGSFILSFVLGFLGMLPYVGWLGWAVVGVIGLGAVLLSRFGTRPGGMHQFS